MQMHKNICQELKGIVDFVKERIRAEYHRLPYNNLPRTLVKYLVSESSRKLTFFPNKRGISKYYSPRMIIHQENLDYKKHCNHSFGEYVLAHNENDRQQKLDCIYLRPTASNQGRHELLQLPTNREIIRAKCISIPITPSIIKQVHALARLGNMPYGLKIKNKTNKIMFDSTWIAEVDYKAEEFNNLDYDDMEGDPENHNKSNDAADSDEESEMDDIDLNKLANPLAKRHVFEPIFPSDLTPEEKRKAMECIIFMVEKRDGTIKTR